MAIIKETDLRKQLSTEQYATLYCLYGEEPLLAKRAALRLKKKIAEGAFSAFNLQEFGNEVQVDQIADAAEALPLMAERKCVMVADYNIEDKPAGAVDKLYQLFSEIPETTTLIFYYPTLVFDAKRSAKWKKFLRTVEQHGDVLAFVKRSKSDLQTLLVKEAGRNGCTLSKYNAGILIDDVGQDLQSLHTELAKLCAYAGYGSEITRQMIDTLVPKSMETTVFLLSNAIVGGQYEKAYLCMDQLFYQKEEPVTILSVLAAAYVDMYRVQASLKSGKGEKGPAEYGDYKGKEFRLGKAAQSARRLTISALRKSLQLLLETDVALKSATGDRRLLMDALIAKLLLLTKGENRA